MLLIKRIALLSLVTGCAVLIGWYFDIKVLQSVLPGLVSMKINAAICFILLGFALLTHQRIIYRILLTLVMIIGGTTLFEYQFGYNWDAVAGRMAYNTALSFTLLGVGLLGLSFGMFRSVCQYLLHVVTILSGVAIMGYVYGVSMFYSFAYVSSMAIHTAVLLLLLSIAGAMLNPELGISRLFVGPGVGNRMARRHFTALMLALIVFGSLRIQSERFHILPPAIGISLLAISLLLASLIMIWITADWLNKVDEQRTLAEAEIRKLNTSLEAKVEKTEEKYHSLFEHASDAIYVLSMTGDFMDVNDSTCELTGYSREELLRMNITALIKAEALKGYKLLFTVIEPGTSVMAERQIITKDGSVVDVEINLKRFVDERILVVARDITARKRMEAELKLSEQKYRLLFEGNPLPLWIVAKDDMTVIAANAAAAKLYGYTSQELTGMDIKQLRPAAYWDTLIANYQADISEPTTFGVVEHIKKDGSPIFVEVVAHDLMFEGRFARLSSTNDVTGKLKAEASLKTSEANLQTILDNTDTAYALLNAELDIVEYNNQALIFVQNEFNFEAGSGRKVFDLMPEDGRQRFIAYTKQVFEGQTISYEISYPQTDSSTLWYYVRMFPIADKGQQILGLVLAITDITERKQAEQSIQAHLAQIREMTWKQSHLIRSPLANLKGLFPLIKTNPADKSALTYAETELERMDQILSKMAEDSAMLDPQGDARESSDS